jgi:putative membrane protein
VYFAAERTLLAWVRTGLAMMGFGFVVARFGLFLHEMAAARGIDPPAQRGLSLWLGTALVVLGVAVNVGAVFLHVRTLRRLDQGIPVRFPAVSLGTVVAIFLGVLGLLMVAYLLLGLGPTR